MFIIITKERKSFLEKSYKGKTIQCIEMVGEKEILPGYKGVVTNVDDVGTLHMNWENGSTLGIIPGLDHFVVIDDEK